MVRFCDLSSNVEVAGMLIAAAMSVDGAGQTPQHVEDSERLLVRFQAWEARVAETRNRVDDGVALAESALARAERSNDVEGAAIAQAALGEILLRRREFVRAASLLHAAARHFAGTAPRHHARVLRLQGTVQWRAGNYSRAREFLKQARSMQESIGDLWETAHVAYTLGGIAFEKGEFSEAQVHADEALRDYEACGDRGHSAWLRGNLALIYQCLGQLDRALEYNGLHVTASRETGNRHALAIALGNRADILAEIGRLDNARQCLDESMSLEGTMGNGWDVARHRAALARLLDLQGEQDLARAHFEQALPVLRAGEARFYAVGPLLDASELALKGGRLEDAEALNQEAGALAERLALEPAIARSRDLDEQIARGRAVATAERHQRAADL
jgi:tetratricopeptide (TPR) repeat protein